MFGWGGMPWRRLRRGARINQYTTDTIISLKLPTANGPKRPPNNNNAREQEYGLKFKDTGICKRAEE